MGYYSRRNEVVITHASSPRKNAIKQPTFIQFDVLHCQKFINTVFTEFKGRISYIGDWHSHICIDLTPSNLDKVELNPEFPRNYT
jgi:hypothetical protein